MGCAHEMNITRLESLWKPWKITGALVFFFLSRVFVTTFYCDTQGPQKDICAPPFTESQRTHNGCLILPIGIGSATESAAAGLEAICTSTKEV